MFRLNPFLRRTVPALSTITSIQTLLSERTKDGKKISEKICELAKKKISHSQWIELVNVVLEKSSQNVVPSILITSASLGYTLDRDQCRKISKSILSQFEAMSDFDRIVTIIGASQIGLRSIELMRFVDAFAQQETSDVTKKFQVPLSLALANLGLQNANFTNKLMAQWDVEKMGVHELTNAILAIVTNRTFPIATIERILTRVDDLQNDFPIEDLVSMTHSMTCLELFPEKFFRHALSKLYNIPSEMKPLAKQIIISVFLDPKARVTAESVSPKVWNRIELDWSLPEEQKNLPGDLLADIATRFHNSGDRVSASLPVPPLSEWNEDVAKRVVLDRIYVSDVPDLFTADNKPIFVHVDDETYSDLEEGPIDAYLQLKHIHVQKAGAKLVWIRAGLWPQLTEEDKIEFIKNNC